MHVTNNPSLTCELTALYLCSPQRDPSSAHDPHEAVAFRGNARAGRSCLASPAAHWLPSGPWGLGIWVAPPCCNPSILELTVGR